MAEPAQKKAKTDEAMLDDFKSSLHKKAEGALQLNLFGLGEELGLFKALLDGPKTPADIARVASCDARYVAEWCLAMAAAGTLSYSKGFYSLLSYLRPLFNDPSHAAGLSDGLNIPAMIMQRPKLVEAFKTGAGISWGEHDHRLFCGTARFFGPFYEKHLVNTMPSCIREALHAGGAVADVGCGEGVSALCLAKAFPKAEVTGIDYHLPSVQAAQRAAAGAGVKNATFVQGDACEFGKVGQFDVVCFLDCFHDMATAARAAVRSFDTLKPGGHAFLIELMASDEDSPTAQLSLPTCAFFSCASCHVCLPCGKCNDGDALGTLCPTSKHRELFVDKAGFKSLELVDVPEVNRLGFRVLLASKDA